MVDLPFAFALNAPLSAVTVCEASSRFAIDTAAPGLTVIEANLNLLISIVDAAVAGTRPAGVADGVGGGSPGPNKSAPAVNKPAPTQTTREPVMRFMPCGTCSRPNRFANRCAVTRRIAGHDQDSSHLRFDRRCGARVARRRAIEHDCAHRLRVGGRCGGACARCLRRRARAHPSHDRRSRVSVAAGHEELADHGGDRTGALPASLRVVDVRTSTTTPLATELAARRASLERHGRVRHLRCRSRTTACGHWGSSPTAARAPSSTVCSAARSTARWRPSCCRCEPRDCRSGRFR